MPHIAELHDSFRLLNIRITPSYVWKIINPKYYKSGTFQITAFSATLASRVQALYQVPLVPPNKSIPDFQSQRVKSQLDLDRNLGQRLGQRMQFPGAALLVFSVLCHWRW